MSKLYRYISQNRYGKYLIRKDNEYYMTCDTLSEALYERDRFEESEWNWDYYIELPITDNKYEYMDLPPFTKSPSYITKQGKYYRVQRKSKKYGYYKTYGEAQKKVDELIESNWGEIGNV